MTTNSISQPFQRRTVERHLAAKQPVSIVFAIQDHPWTKATRESAAVRIAMTVAEAGKKEGDLWEVIDGTDPTDNAPQRSYRARRGLINPDLSLGIDLTRTAPLKAAAGICSRGMQLMGAGFIVSDTQARNLGLGQRAGLERHIRAYRNGKDLTAHSRNSLVIDLLGLSAEDVRQRFPEVYQHVTERVRYDLGPDGQPRTDASGRKLGREWNNRQSYRQNWWIFGEPRKDLRPALEGLPRYIATVETAKHRVFQFLDGSILPDNRLVCILPTMPRCFRYSHHPFTANGQRQMKDGWKTGRSIRNPAVSIHFRFPILSRRWAGNCDMQARNSTPCAGRFWPGIPT